ncbi:aminotransferase class V-fold PLP-dependent enzyme [Actinomyces sp. B33]|uniref:cysteine desulfurase family protein n=1 Tax=Actinomyces sp. B33 TaxID=2942131 RepID=UPI00233FFAF2|nr:aminotransferase class V-fold PLP-dependent enzyme [Actinomyces sp. B33]MDC4232876.1 aminotransferase class V-fold PLP-dependent enzyme [Actinomyces sp. B33]
MTHYLDHAATAPILPEALEAWARAQRDLAASPGNPASLHSGGRRAKRALEDARERIGAALGAERHEVVLTSGATEADALGVVGAARAARERDPRRRTVVVSGAEHDAVGEQARVLSRDGFDVMRLDLDRDGVSVLDPALAGLAPTIACASMTLVCAETGARQPVGDLVSLLRAGGAGAADHSGPAIHTDAAQAIALDDVDFARLGVDALSVGGHKIGAPVGTGALLVRRSLPVTTDRPGGGHERGLRSGTPDVAGACALAAALETVVARRDRARARAEGLRDRLLASLPDGVVATVPADRSLASIIHLTVPTSRPEAVLMSMDMAGVLVSVGSACHAGVARPSRILMRMGRTQDEALGVLRVSTGFDTTRADIDALLAALPAAIEAGLRLDGRGREAAGA